MLHSLPDPTEPELASVRDRFERFLAEQKSTQSSPEAVLDLVNTFVCREIPYSWDWEVWGVADYTPTVAEVIKQGREDCDGRAVLAAALLRARGIPAELVADTRHMWVRTPYGQTMNPLGPPVFQTEGKHVRVRWSGLLDLGPAAFGISVFPILRELIVVLALWLLMLPAQVDRRSALLALGFLVQGLLIIRLAGTDPIHPQVGGILLGLANILLAVGGLWVIGFRLARQAKTGAMIPTGLSVYENM